MFEAGVRFGNDCFVRFAYNETTKKTDITVITPEETLTGSVTVAAPAGATGTRTAKSANK